ncbi:MAG TPA: hypothetical protein VN840_09895, partial [Streptosporangiaceae bacterium]|nr:hypothetical protein [Streptosporangiaceae bacterium]
IPHIPDEATEGRASISIYLPLTISAPSPVRLAVTAALLLISLTVMFFPGLTHLHADLARNIGTILFVLTIAGPSRTLTSLWPAWPWGQFK